MIISIVRSPHTIGVDFPRVDTLEDVAVWLHKMPYKSKTNDLILIKSEEGVVEQYALVIPRRKIKIYEQRMSAMGDVISTFSMMEIEHFQPYCWNSAYFESNSNTLMMIIAQISEYEFTSKILAKCILCAVKSLDASYRKAFKEDIAYARSVEENKFAILDAGSLEPMPAGNVKVLTELFYNFKIYLRYRSYVTVDRIIDRCRSLIKSDNDVLLPIIRKQCPLALFLDSVGE